MPTIGPFGQPPKPRAAEYRRRHPWAGALDLARADAAHRADQRRRAGIQRVRPTVDTGAGEILALDDPNLYAWIREAEPAVNFMGENTPLRSLVDRTGPSLYSEYESQMIHFGRAIPANELVAFSFRCGTIGDIVTTGWLGGSSHFLYCRYLETDFDPAAVAWNDRAGFGVYRTETVQFAVTAGDSADYVLDLFPDESTGAGLGHLGSSGAPGPFDATPLYGVEIHLAPACADTMIIESIMDLAFSSVQVYLGQA